MFARLNEVLVLYYTIVIVDRALGYTVLYSRMKCTFVFNVGRRTRRARPPRREGKSAPPPEEGPPRAESGEPPSPRYAEGQTSIPRTTFIYVPL